MSMQVWSDHLFHLDGAKRQGWPQPRSAWAASQCHSCSLADQAVPALLTALPNGVSMNEVPKGRKRRISQHELYSVHSGHSGHVGAYYRLVPASATWATRCTSGDLAAACNDWHTEAVSSPDTG